MLRFATLLVMLAMASVSCFDQNLIRSNPDDSEAYEEYFDPNVPANTVEIAPETYVEPGLHMRPGIEVYEIPSPLNGDLDIGNAEGTVLVRGEALVEIEGIEIGDILVTDSFIARVRAIEQRADGLFLRMEDFQIWEIVHGEWSLSIPLDSEGNTQYDIDQSDYMVRRQMLSNTFEVGVSASYRGLKIANEASLTTSAQPHLKFEGKIPFYSSSSDYHCDDPQIKVDIGCAFGGCAKRYRYCVDYLMMNIEMGAEFTASSTLTATVEDKLEAPEEKRMIEQTLGQIPLAGPFTMRPSLYVDRQAYLKASLEGELKVEASASASVPLGFEYINGKGYSMIPNANYPASGSASLSGTASLKAKIEAGVWGEAGLVFAICTPDLGADVCFKGLEAGGRLTLKAAQEDGISSEAPGPDDHCLSASLELEAVVRGKVEAEVSAFGFSKSALILEATFSPFKTELLSWNGGGEYCSGEHQLRLEGINALFDRDVDCSSEADNALAGTCAEKFLKPCFDPQGTCTGRMYEDGSYDMEWTTGERYFNNVLEHEENGDGYAIPSLLSGDFFGTDETHCAEDRVEVSFMSGGPVPTCEVTAVLTLLDGVSDFDGEYLPGDTLTICEFPSGATRVSCPGEPAFTVERGNDRGICMAGGPCEFELGYLEELDENRALADVPSNAM